MREIDSVGSSSIKEWKSQNKDNKYNQGLLLVSTFVQFFSFIFPATTVWDIIYAVFNNLETGLLKEKACMISTASKSTSEDNFKL